MAESISRGTILTLLILVVLLSVVGTITVLTNIDSSKMQQNVAGQNTENQQQSTSSAQGYITLEFLPPEK